MTVTSSIGGMMASATTGLAAAQVGLSTTSDNVANANTPGYVRKVVNQSSLVNQGAGAGVTVDGIKRVTDAYLESASLTANASSNKADVMSSMLDQVQSLFGDPSSTDSYFSGLNDVFTQFSALANNPSSSLQKDQSLESLQTFFDDTTRVATSLSDQKDQADTQIQSDVSTVNDLLSQIADLNGDIVKAQVTGADSSGSQNIQAQNISKLSALLDVQVTTGPDGASVVRTPDGMLLADKQAGTVTYNQSTTAANFLTVTPANGGGQTFDGSFNGGEIVGLLQMRNVEIPNALAQLNQFAGTTADMINQAHNANSASPPPATLTGKNTGLDLPTAVGGFTGKTNIALLDSTGAIAHQVAITFSPTGGSISLDGGAATTFTPATFLATLNSTLGTNGSASFTNGALTLTAASGNGVAVVDDPTNAVAEGRAGVQPVLRHERPYPIQHAESQHRPVGGRYERFRRRSDHHLSAVRGQWDPGARCRLHGSGRNHDHGPVGHRHERHRHRRGALWLVRAGQQWSAGLHVGGQPGGEPVGVVRPHQLGRGERRGDEPDVRPGHGQSRRRRLEL